MNIWTFEDKSIKYRKYMNFTEKKVTEKSSHDVIFLTQFSQCEKFKVNLK